MRPSSSDEDETKDRLAAEIHLEAKGGCMDDSKQHFQLPKAMDEWEEFAGE